MPGAKTLVKFVDDEGQPIATDARELLGVKELQTVVIQGQAKKDDDGNVTILASAIYIDPTNPGQVIWGEAAGEHDHTHEHGESGQTDNDGASSDTDTEEDS